MFQFLTIFLLTIIFPHVSSQTTYTCSSSASCGCSASSASVSRIVGGEYASSQTWGWAASLRYTSSNSHFCGGSIISPWHILTAAHCTQNLPSAASVTVVVGSIYLSSGGQSRNVSKIYIHPAYSSTTYLNDISILKLSSPLDLSQVGINQICLPSVSSAVLTAEEYPAANVSLVAIGWGVTVEGSSTVSPVLQQVTIMSIAASTNYCRNAGIVNALDQLCAGVMPGGGKDTCQGDSGGPLMMFKSNYVWEQIGITSNGYGCAKPNFPGLYTRVAAYQTWINDTMNNSHRLFFLSYMILVPLIQMSLF